MMPRRTSDSSEHPATASRKRMPSAPSFRIECQQRLTRHQLFRRLCLPRRDARDEKREVERGADTLGALHPDGAAVALDDLLADVETQAEAAVIGRRDLSSAMEALEHLRQLVGGDADAAITDRRNEVIALVLDADHDL